VVNFISSRTFFRNYGLNNIPYFSNSFKVVLPFGGVLYIYILLRVSVSKTQVWISN
jgi:hypothetical protein